MSPFIIYIYLKYLNIVNNIFENQCNPRVVYFFSLQGLEFFKILTWCCIFYYYILYIFSENMTYWYLRVETYAAKLVKKLIRLQRTVLIRLKSRIGWWEVKVS